MDYSQLAEVYEKLEKTSKRLEKTFIISKFLKKVPIEELDYLIILLQGRVFQQWDDRKIGMSSKLLIKVIAKSTGESTNKIEQLLNKVGDLGIVAQQLMEHKKQKTLFSQKLTINKVMNNIRKLSVLEGAGTVDKKIGLASELLTSATALEAKFIVRTIMEDLRAGIAEGTLRDAIVWTYLPRVKGIFEEFYKEDKEKVLKIKKLEDIKDTNKYDIIEPEGIEPREVYNYLVQQVQNAYDVTTNFTKVAEKLKEKGLQGLEETGLTVGNPIKVMLYQKAEDVKDALKQVGSPAYIEPKFDGFRMQIHKKGNEIKLFTRRLEEVTNQFPDIEEIIRKQVRANNFILDSEIIGIDPKTKKFVPFQAISQRIKRKHNIQEIIKKLPVAIMIFDAIQINGDNLLHLPLGERRKKIKAIVKESKREIELVEQLKSSDEKKIQIFYEKALAEGHEGVMLKNTESIYKPGSRVGFGVKLKPTMETLDLVIVGAEWGEGKRAKWLSSFVLACRDRNQFVEIGKVGTGIKEKTEEGVSFEELTEELKPLIIDEKGKKVKVKGKIVVEINYQEIQKSPTYSSGYALRFPRVIRIRVDRTASDCDTLQRVKRLYDSQKNT